MQRVIAFVGMLCGVLGFAISAAANPPVVTFLPITLSTAAGELTSGQRFGRLEFIAAHQLTSDAHKFGGISSAAFDVTEQKLYLMTDRGRIFASIPHFTDGVLDAMDMADIVTLQGKDGQKLVKPRYDCEAMVLLPHHQARIMFEQQHRIARYDLTTGALLKETLLPEGMTPLLADNQGFEAFAPLDAKRSLMISENSRQPQDDLLRGWIARDDNYAPVLYRNPVLFSPTEMLKLGDEMLVLERKLDLLGGRWAARLAAFPVAFVKPNAVLEGQEWLRFPVGSGIDNMEAMALVTLPNKEQYLLVFSDDNFNPLQKTIMLQFRVR